MIWGWACFEHLTDMVCLTLGYSVINTSNTSHAGLITVEVTYMCKIGLNPFTHCKHLKRIHTHTKRCTPFVIPETQLSAVCSVKWGRFPVMFLSPHPAPLLGALMPPPSRRCLTELIQSVMSGEEMSSGPRYDRETGNTEVFCPVGMEVITERSTSSCRLLFP